MSTLGTVGWLLVLTALGRAPDNAPDTRGAPPPAVITGRVTTTGGAPISNAIVSLRSVQASTTTDDAGQYRLVVAEGRVRPGPDSLRVTRIGFKPASVPFALAEGSITVDVTMTEQVIALEQVVVTGTAGNQERRAQAAVVASIDAAQITATAPVLDVNELLTARTPGVSMTKGSGTAGSNTRIDIRGQASISLSNYPLVFVDGVRMVAGPRGVAQAPGGTTAGAGGQQFSSLNDINPDDIESIEVVKGPAASTLYGSDASAGVIQIITKKGRAGTRRFTQRLTAEYNNVAPNFTPYDNYGRCTAALVAATSTNPLCRGQAVGTIIRDNVLVRNDVFNDGWAGSLSYNATGGGENFGYYGSFAADNEKATSPGGFINHRAGRVNANWIATPKLSADINLALIRAADRLPQGDQSSFGYLLGGDFGQATTVTTGPDGRLAGGWFNNNLSVEAIKAITTEDVTLRAMPSVQLRYTPVSWLSNRLTLGADLLRTTATQQFPKNDRNWYGAVANTGSVAVVESNVVLYTVDYLGNINTRFGRDGRISSDLSFGSQWINTTSTSLSGSGQGLLTNANNLVSAATTSTVGQGYGQTKSLGFLVQEQIGFRDRLFLQVGGRVDRNSAFGEQVGSLFLPKAGISYVVSEESFWKGLASAIPTLRLRAAYGTTGRSPSGTATLQTYSRSTYLTETGAVAQGVIPGNPGNPGLKPERGIEIEGGLDAGFLGGRVGVELTYFSKTSKDLLLSRPLPPSAGFTSSPVYNIGEVTNKGLEAQLRATPVRMRNVSWDATLNVNTLANKIVSMGDITPFVSNNQCFKPGVEIAAWCVQQVVRVDSAANRAFVSDTAMYAGGQLPKYQGSVTSTLTLFRALRVYAQVDGKFDYHVYNLTRDLRDRSVANSGDVVLPADQGGYSPVERLRRLGPFTAERSGATVGNSLIRGSYIERGDFVRLREVSVTWSVPQTLSRRLRVSGTSISVGGRNLGLWSDYSGWDPEVLGTADIGTPFLGDVFTLPQARRTFARISVQF